MNLAKELDKKIEKKAEEIKDLEHKLGQARAYLQALHDMRRMIPREAAAAAEVVLRPGSDIAKVREFLQNEGKPLHVDDLLKRLGKQVSKGTKAALSGSLAAYVRDGKIFTKTGPNIFGLLEFAHSAPEDVEPSEEDVLPATFGVLNVQ